jgi:hypothetical protein
MASLITGIEYFRSIEDDVTAKPVRTFLKRTSANEIDRSLEDYTDSCNQLALDSIVLDCITSQIVLFGRCPLFGGRGRLLRDPA